jgi:tetratricopeptide (TPR) repeat protein
MRGSAFATSVALVLALALPAAGQPVQRAEDDSAALVAVGRGALDRGDLGEAARALDQAIALNPRRIEAYVLRAAVHLARRELAAGIGLLRRARALAPDSPDVATMLGTLLLADGKADEAVPLLEDVVRRDRRRYQAQVALGRHHASRGRWADAAVALEAYLAVRPPRLAASDPTIQSELADAYLRAGEPRRARALFDRVVRARPDDVRARLGQAWAAAAIDCRRARPLLAALEPLAPSYPSVWLVAARCAIATGDPGTGARLGGRVAGRADAPPALRAAGHAVVGDAEAARGNLPAARAALERALAGGASGRRTGLALARVLRLAGDHAAARARLDAVGAPAPPASDPAWWHELGELLLASSEPAVAAERLRAVAPALPRDATLRVILGEALLVAGDEAGAIAALDEAERLRSSLRGRRALGRALERAGGRRLAAGALDEAGRQLERAEALAPTAGIQRNLGVIRLAQGRPADAVGPLERAARTDPVALLLLGRARAALGEVAAARRVLARAAEAAAGEARVDVALEAAAIELAAGAPATAAGLLDRVTALATGSRASRHRDALAIARHAAGVAALRAGDATAAVSWLDAALKVVAAGERDRSRAIACDLAVATVAAGDRDAALRRLRGLGAAPCPYPGAAATQAVPILTALADGLRASRARAALRRLAALGGTATGTAAGLHRAAVRAVAIHAADEAYRAGDLAAARRYLDAARRAGARDDEVAADLAIVAIAAGRGEPGGVLERIAPRHAEALISIGLAWDRRGDAPRALEAWQRARKAGVRFAPLADWIAAKEALWGPLADDGAEGAP